MASRSSGKLMIISDATDGSESTGGSQQQQQQGQQKGEISDDDDGTTSDDMEITFSGIEAVKIYHFCKTELENLGKYLHARVSKEPPEGSPTKVTITGDKKYATDIRTNVDKMKDQLKNLTEEVVKLDVTKVNEVRQLARQYRKTSGVLVHISAMEFKVYVIAVEYEKMSQALHQVKIALGLIATSTRTGRQTESSAESKGTKKLYPSLPGNDRTEEDMETEEYGARGDGAVGRDPAGTDVGQPYRKPRRHQRERSPYNKHNDKTGQYSVSNDNDDFEFTYRFDSGFLLKVYKASITKLDVDSIVNAANDNLMHGGGVARVISKAAGYELDRESDQYVQRNGLLEVGENCLTTAGNLRRYESVIHAVGPQWYNYSDKEHCLHALHGTVLNVLRRAAEENFKSVAMSAISAGIYAVPKELCADMYVQAVVDFINMKKRCPKELHIVDIDTSILKLVEASCKRWQRDSESIKPAEALKQYMKQHPYAAGYSGQGRGRGRRIQRQFSEPASETVGASDALKGLLVKKEATVPLLWGGEKIIFSVNDSVKVHLYTGKIDKVTDVDAVVCSTDTGFGTNGYIVKAFHEAFGEKYKRNFNKMKKEKSQATLTYVYICETGSVTAPYVMHLAMKPLVYGNGEELKEYKKGISNTLNKAEQKKFSKIALPLLGTGNVQSRPDVLKSCCRCVLEALQEFCCYGNSKYLTDVHIVNNKKEVTQLMRNWLEDAEKAPRGSEKPRINKASYDSEENIRDNKQFSKSLTETRVYGSRSSNVAEKSESDGFESFARSRVSDDREQTAPDYRSTVKPAAVGGLEQPENIKPDKKKTGNLRIFEDD